MGIIKAIRKMFGAVKAADKERVELRRVSAVFGTLERLERSGLLAWQERDRRLFIAEPLAVVQLRSREAWDAFMQNVMMWALYKRQSEAWERVMVRAEGEAIRKASSDGKRRSTKLTDAEVMMIRQSARDAVSEGAVAVPKVEGFEVFVVAPPQPSPSGREHHAEGTGAAHVIAVGRYDVDRGVTDMVMWEEVKTHLPTSSR